MRFLFFALIFVFLPASGLSMDTGSKWVTIECSINIGEDESIREARLRLLNMARMEAVSEVAGVDIQSIQILIQSETSGSDQRDEWVDDFQTFYSVGSRGKIIREREPEYERRIENEDIIMSVTYEAEVAVEKGNRDPNFRVDFSADQSTYRIGEAVQLMIHSNTSNDAYVTIFSVLRDGTASVIFPNPYFRENRLQGFETREIPDEYERMDAEFTILLRDEIQPPYSEMILLVATKNPHTYTSLENTLQYNTSFTKINRWLMDFPLDQRVEVFTSYSVTE